MVSKFRDFTTLRQEGRSPDMVRKVLVSLGSIIADAQDHGLVAHNAVRELRRNRKRGKDRQAELRRKGKLKVGKDIPTLDEISLILHHAPARWRPVLLVAAYTGLRASRASRATLGRCQLQGLRPARQAASRQVQRHRGAEVGSWRSHGSLRQDRGEHS